MRTRMFLPIGPGILLFHVAQASEADRKCTRRDLIGLPVHTNQYKPANDVSSDVQRSPSVDRRHDVTCCTLADSLINTHVNCQQLLLPGSVRQDLLDVRGDS